MIPEFPDFAPLTMTAAGHLGEHLKTSQPEVSELSLGYLYGYNGFYDFSLSGKSDALLIHGIIDGIPSFLAPLGKGTAPELLRACIGYLERKHGGGRIHALTEADAKLLTDLPLPDGWVLKEDRDDADYVYSVKDLAELKGNMYHPKKNLVKQFSEKYRFEFLDLSEALVEKCIGFQKKWCGVRSCEGDISLAMENIFVETLLNNYGRLHLFGGIILINGKCEAFTLAEELNRNTCVVHAEKANTEYKGIYQAVNNLFCSSLLGKYEFVNREQDMGIAGLRKAKLSYRPRNLIKKYDLIFSGRAETSSESAKALIEGG
ncbi:MAG TPA: phosphatidylglycerol lysyltransferase domain-containing protein [bacterium]|nr:phosphatidylglycerol lysyltransferase domain-containing protein [bacterium]